MRITPLDVRKQEFRKGMRGLDAEEVYAFLATVADEYEAVLNDNKALRERLLELDDKVQEYRSMEKTLRDTLLTAERVTVDAKDNARREANIIIKEAQIEAEKALRDIKGEAMKLRQQVQQLRSQREAYLGRMKLLAESHVHFVDTALTDFHSDDRELSSLGVRSPGARAVSDVRGRADDPVEASPSAPPAGVAPAAATSRGAAPEREVDVPGDPGATASVAVPGEPVVAPAAAPGEPVVAPAAAPGEPVVAPAAAPGEPVVPPAAASGEPVVPPARESYAETSSQTRMEPARPIPDTLPDAAARSVGGDAAGARTNLADLADSAPRGDSSGGSSSAALSEEPAQNGEAVCPPSARSPLVTPAPAVAVPATPGPGAQRPAQLDTPEYIEATPTVTAVAERAPGSQPAGALDDINAIIDRMASEQREMTTRATRDGSPAGPPPASNPVAPSSGQPMPPGSRETTIAPGSSWHHVVAEDTPPAATGDVLTPEPVAPSGPVAPNDETGEWDMEQIRREIVQGEAGHGDA